MADGVTYTDSQIWNSGDHDTSTVSPVNFVITNSDGNVPRTYPSNLSGNGVVNYYGAVVKNYLILNGNNSEFSGTFTMFPSTATGAAMFFSSTTAGSGNATWKFENNTFVRANLSSNGTIQLGALEGSGRLRNDESTKGVTVTYEIGGANKDATFSGLIENEYSGHNSGTYTAVTKVGTGTQTLTGANTYTGATKITDGTLRLEGDGNIASTSSVNISASATGKVATLEFAQTSGTVDFSKDISSDYCSRDPAVKFEKSGTIKKSGGATLNLSGKLFKSGLVTTAGTLNIGTSTTPNINENTLGYLDIGGTTSDNATVNYYGGSGSLLLYEFVTAHYVGSADNGTGTLNICSGTVKSNREFYIGSGSTAYTANGFVTVKNGATLETCTATIDGKSVSASLHVGGNGNGTLTIDAGGTVKTAGNMTVNEHTVTTSSAINNGSLTVGGNLTVGEYGTGILTNGTGGTMNVAGVTTIGFWGQTTTSGTLINNGSITVNSYVEVGSEENGIGELILNTGSTFTANNSSNIHLSTRGNKNGSGTLTVNGGTLSAGNSTLYLNNNTTSTSTASLEIKNNGSVTLNKIVIGNTNSVAGSATLTLNNGTLSVSDVEVNSSKVTNVINLGDGTVITGSANENNGCWWGAVNVNLTSESGTKIQVDSGKAVKFNSTMTGDGGLEKTGDGTLSLSYQTKGYKGKTTVTAGTLNLMYANVLENSSQVINNSTITLSEDTYKGTTPNQTLNNLSGNGTINVGTYNLTLNNNETLTDGTIYSGTISGSGTLEKTGDYTLTLSGINSSFTGDTTITGGILKLAGDGTLGSGNITNNTTLELAGNATLSNVISGSGQVIKSGTGTTTLSGENTYQGGTTISGGTLKLTGSGTLSSSSVSIGENGTLEFGYADNKTLSDTVSEISGSGTIVKSGTGTLTVSNALSSYTGKTTISEGTLLLNSNGTLGTTGAVTLNGGTLHVDKTSTTLSSLTGSGNLILSSASGETTITSMDQTGGSTTIASGASLKVGSGTGITSIYNLSSDTYDTPATRSITLNGDTLKLYSSDKTVTKYVGQIFASGKKIEKAGNGDLQILLQAEGQVRAESFVLSSGRLDIKSALIGDKSDNYAALEADLYVQGGTFSPGNSVGVTKLAKDETMTIESGGTLLVEIDGEGASHMDQIIFDSESTKTEIEFKSGSIVELTTIDGYTPNLTDDITSTLFANIPGIQAALKKDSTTGKSNATFKSYFYQLNYDAEGNVTGVVVNPNAVPEPSTWALLILGFAGLMWYRKHERR